MHIPGLRVSGDVDVNYHSSTKLQERYQYLRIVGEGSCGTVFLCKEIKTKKIVAVKSFKTNCLKGSCDFIKEVAIARRLHHGNIVTLHAAFRDRERFYLVMENLDGGDLSLALKRNPHGISSHLIMQWSFALLSAVAYLHHHLLCHRDIKIENVLLKRKGQNHPIKLIDFNLSTRFKIGELIEGSVGTPYTMAPEVARGQPYSETIDVWSAGVVVFELCTGCVPYRAQNRFNLLQLIETQEVPFDDKLWSRHPKELAMLVGEMMNRDPQMRKDAMEILGNYSFLKDGKQRQLCCWFSRS